MTGNNSLAAHPTYTPGGVPFGLTHWEMAMLSDETEDIEKE